jgi:hypothetical protein
MKRRQLVSSLFALLVGGAFGGISVPAFAKRGRPASRNSIGGARRRTSRRQRRRISRNMRLSSLPYGCSVRRNRGGVSYYYCQGIWYQPVYQGTTVVYIVNEIESGASTDVEFG